MERPWVVWLCSVCEHAYGRSKKSKDSRCPHCNQTERSVMSSHSDASEARKAISLLNTPPEIRDQLQHWVEKNESMDFRPMKSKNVDGNSVLDLAENDEGFVTLDALQIALNSLQSTISAEEFAENACAAGELMITGSGIWQRV